MDGDRARTLRLGRAPLGHVLGAVPARPAPTLRATGPRPSRLLPVRAPDGRMERPGRRQPRAGHPPELGAVPSRALTHGHSRSPTPGDNWDAFDSATTVEMG